jgi:hypothetical protein
MALAHEVQLLSRFVFLREAFSQDGLVLHWNPVSLGSNFLFRSYRPIV